MGSNMRCARIKKINHWSIHRYFSRNKLFRYYIRLKRKKRKERKVTLLGNFRSVICTDAQKFLSVHYYLQTVLPLATAKCVINREKRKEKILCVILIEILR